MVDLGPKSHPKLHAPDHSENAVDELIVENLGATSTDTTVFYRPDGTGGVELANPVDQDLHFRRIFLLMGGL